MLKTHLKAAGVTLAAIATCFSLFTPEADAGSDRSPVGGFNVEFRDFDLNAFFFNPGAPYSIEFPADQGFFYAFNEASNENIREAIFQNQDVLPLLPPVGTTADFLPPTFYNGTPVNALSQESSIQYFSEEELAAAGRSDLPVAVDVLSSSGEVIGEARVIAKAIKVEKLNPAAPDPSLLAVAPFARLTVSRTTSFRWNNKAVVHTITNRHTGKEYILFVAPVVATTQLPLGTVGGLAPILYNPQNPATPFFQANWQYKSCVLQGKLVVEADGRLEVLTGSPGGWQHLNGNEVACRTKSGEFFQSP